MQLTREFSAPLVCRLMLVTLLGITAPLAIAQPAFNASKSSTGPEMRAAKALEAARKQGPVALHAFLVAMPKGSDLHVHLSGAVYAESFIRAAGDDGLCVDPQKLSFAKPTEGECGNGRVSAKTLPANQHLYDELIDAFSMRTFVPITGTSGHDHFFDSFDKFSGTSKKHTGEWLDEVATRAAAQNEQYMELMVTPDFSHTAGLAKKIGYNSDLPELRKALLDAGLRDDIAIASQEIKEAQELRRKLEHCDTTEATPGAKVELRFIYQVLRAFPRTQVFAQTLLGFEIASANNDFVGINYVQPEDNYTAMADYHEQMRMLDYLHSVYPKVKISLHAGELAPGLVPDEGLSFHIREAVEKGHADRIGHGVDVMYEDRPYELLKEMAAKHVMVEINLTSNDVILNIKGGDHPFPLYRKFHVPVALSTDDEGVSRIDLTHEYVRAVAEYNLSYSDLKQMVRAGLEHDFLPGKSLWRSEDDFRSPQPECAQQPLGAEKPTAACQRLLDSSEKARQQWELERRFRVFEASPFPL
jgi:adenosine deaminase